MRSNMTVKNLGQLGVLLVIHAVSHYPLAINILPTVALFLTASGSLVTMLDPARTGVVTRLKLTLLFVIIFSSPSAIVFFVKILTGLSS